MSGPMRCKINDVLCRHMSLSFLYSTSIVLDADVRRPRRPRTARVVHGGFIVQRGDFIVALDELQGETFFGVPADVWRVRSVIGK